MDFNILVLSCDKYENCWEPFFGLLDRYYPSHPKTYLVTETKQCKYSDTININNSIWSYRFREALKQIPTKYVLVMLDDFFLRERVDAERINNIKFQDNDIVYNFEMKFRPGKDMGDWSLQFQNQMYLNSCQPSLWDKEKLIERLSKDESAWDWELTIINSPYNHYVNSGSTIMNVGNDHSLNWGIVRGKISNECQTLLNTEGYPIAWGNKKLSIITPYYKTLKEIRQLAAVLESQLTDEVEWIIVDDGCNESGLDTLKARVFHLSENSSGASRPRNIALDNAIGEYICFIDSDDLVTEDYISTILNTINNKDFDYCYFSWRYIKDPTNIIEITDEPPFWNTSLWNCIYKKNLIGNIRFDETKRFAEDTIFNYQVRKGKKEIINKVLYLYNTDRPGNLSSLMDNQ